MLQQRAPALRCVPPKQSPPQLFCLRPPDAMPQKATDLHYNEHNPRAPAAS